MKNTEWIFAIENNEKENLMFFFKVIWDDIIWVHSRWANHSSSLRMSLCHLSIFTLKCVNEHTETIYQGSVLASEVSLWVISYIDFDTLCKDIV